MKNGTNNQYLISKSIRNCEKKNAFKERCLEIQLMLLTIRYHTENTLIVFTITLK